MNEIAAIYADDSGHAIFKRLKRPPERGVLCVDPALMPVPPPVPAQPAPAAVRSDARAAPDWLAECDLEHLAPAAAKLLTRVWGTPAAVKALRALLLDGDGLVRRLAPALWSELALLCRLHRLAYPGCDAALLPQVDSFALLETAYRHVLKRLLASWGNVEAFAVVHHDLVIDYRGGRNGWPAEVWDDLVLLQHVHDRVFGPLPEGATPWNAFFLRE